jgi:hypothetical protein
MDTSKNTPPATSEATECFACYEGVVYIGHLVEDEDGDTAEVFEPVPCRRCARPSGRARIETNVRQRVDIVETGLIADAQVLDHEKQRRA